MKKFLLYLSLPIFLANCNSISKEPIDYVDPFIGTGFHGHTYPGATTPYGAVQLSPDTRTGNWDACSGYHYSDSTIIGFSHTHLSGTGCADLGDILFHPTTKQLEVGDKRIDFQPLLFSHKDEKASPGYYSVNFKQEGVLAEMTATTYAGVHRYTFNRGLSASIIIDMDHVLTDETIDMKSLKKTGANEITGMRRSQGWVTDQYVHFVVQFSKDFDDVKVVDNNSQAIVQFGESDGQPIVARVGISIVSEENAKENLVHDVKSFDFDHIHAQARETWVKEMETILVESKNEKDLHNFYTAIYHSKIVPNIASDINGQFRKHDMSIGTQKEGDKYYSTFSLWDTFRAWNPLMTLINTDLVNDMSRSFVTMYDASGELPLWPLSAGETYTMIGYHSVSVLADAYLKGILSDDFDIQHAYEAMKVSSDNNKKGSDYYIKYGFIPSNIKRESVSCLLEYAYDDWCIAQVATKLGHKEDAERYTQRALSYINVFDGDTKFLRGKRLDGNWESPFNPYAPGRAYTEATAWQYRYFVPHDVKGMAQLFGGYDEFTNALDDLFTADSKIDGDMVDITGLIGQYGQGNEPSHHMAYLFNYVGQPWKTQYWTRRILNELYDATPEGIIGNEDCGQMSAWYILSSLGFYQVCPGTDQFILTSPLFNKSTINLANGKTLAITANNPSKNIYIEKVILNGEEITNNYLTYTQIMEGGVLEYVLTDKANETRGVDKKTFPYSLTEVEVASIPYTTKDLDLFENEIEVPLASATKDAKIYYTMDGKEPTEQSELYTNPLKINKSLTIRAKAFKEGYQASNTFTIKATKAELKKAVRAQGSALGVKYNYYEGNFSWVADVLKAKVLKSGVMSQPSIKDAAQEDHFAYVFEGFILAPEDGVYEFMTKSDDGSVLHIGGDLVVNNDGSHAAIVATGRIALHKGLHPYKLVYFEDYEGEHLSWGWKIPSAKEFGDISEKNLFVR